MWRVLLVFPFVVSLAAAKPPPDTQARLDAFAQGKPGGIAVAWVDPDGVAFFNAGKFSAADARAITPDTQFEIGSLTKVFTALLLAESERAGKVSRHDSVAKYLLPAGDPLAAKLGGLTLLTLATHTSGLRRLPSDFSLWRALTDKNPYASLTRADLVASLRRDGPRARPPAEFSYSNFGFALLGEALAAAGRTSYEEALRASVLAPLGLEHTGLALTGRDLPPEFAPPHGGGKPVPAWTQDAYAPCGALRSSARDLAKFLQAALGGPGAPLQAAFAATTKAQSATANGMVGLAWIENTLKRPTIIWHNGGTGGSRSYLGFIRETCTGIVVLTNHDVSVDVLAVGLLRGDAPGKQ